MDLPEVPKVEVGELLKHADAGDAPLLLDVRNDEDFDRWKLEGRKPLDTVHVPYFDFIEDEEAAMAKLPKDREIVVLCASGDSSEMIAEMMNEKGMTARNVAGGMAAYGNYLQPVELPLAPDEKGRFEVWQLNRRGKGCLSYVIRAQDEAILVDPSRDEAQYEAFLKKLGARLVQVLDTHVHADHKSGGPEIAANHGVPYYVAASLSPPGSGEARRSSAKAAGGDFELKKKVTPLEDGAEIELGGKGGVRVVVQAVKTPGHTPGSTSYLIGGRYLLSGDTIFVQSVGRPDLGGQVVEWGKSLYHTLKKRIASLADDTIVLPAHYADVSEIGKDGVVSGRLGDLRRTVPELQIDNEADFVEAMRRAVKDPPPTYADIIKINLGVLDVPEEKIAEWELGKNECAAKAARGRAS